MLIFRSSFLPSVSVFALVLTLSVLACGSDADAADASPPEAVIEAPPEAPVADSIRIRAVGDVMLGTDFPSARYLPPNGGADVLAQVADLLRDADLTFMNLEGPFLDGGVSSKCRAGSTSCYAFRTPTSYGQWLADIDLDLASIANNHAMDFTNRDPMLDGRQSTIRILDSLGIAWSGPAGTFASVEADGVRVAMAAYHAFNHSNYLNDEPAAGRFIAEIAEDHDIVIVSFHGGAEGGAIHVPRGRETYYGENRGDLRLFSRTVIDAGADLVIGHGPHVPRGIEVYKGRLIAYSLGNFATYGRFSLRGNNGLAPILDVTLARDGALLDGRVLSAKQIGEGIPVPDDAGRAARLMSDLSATDFPESEATVFADGRIRVRDAE
ncbi:MAG: CapA family protein [Bacteroidota bacterium]